MSYTNTTEHYNLPQYIGTDKPTYLGDMNSAYRVIDAALYEANTNATAAGGALAETTQTATNANTQAQENKSNIASIRANVLQVSQNLENSKAELNVAKKIPVVINNSTSPNTDVIYSTSNPTVSFYEIDLKFGKIFYIYGTFNIKSRLESKIIDIVRCVTFPELSKYWSGYSIPGEDCGIVSVQGTYKGDSVRDYTPSIIIGTDILGRNVITLNMASEGTIMATPNVNILIMINKMIFVPNRVID